MKYVDSLVILVCMTLLVVFIRACGVQPPATTVIRERLDTVQITVPQVVLRDAPARTRIVHDTILDERRIAALTSMIDSLHSAMSRVGARREFTLDTVVGRGDSIRVICDETRRRVSVWVRPAPVDTIITITDTLTVLPRPLNTTIVPYLTAAATVNPNGVWSGQGNAGLLWDAGSAKPFADVQFNATTGIIGRIGITVTF